MSNHSGGYMLNNVLNLCERKGILDTIGKEEAIKFIKEIVDIGDGYDCNAYEILDGISDKYSMCNFCLEIKENLDDGLCKECR